MTTEPAESAYVPLVVTAAFGEGYRWAAGGLLESLRESNPSLEVLVFADAEIPGSPTYVTRVETLLDGFPEYYRSGQSRMNVTKFTMLRLAAGQSSAQDLLWIDADSLVFGDLAAYGRSGAVNVNRHGGRRGHLVDCGNGLVVPGEDYAIGSIWGIPNSEVIFDYFCEIVDARLTWPDAERMSSGDQILVNHLRADLDAGHVKVPVHWLSDETEDIINYRIAVTGKGHPAVGRSNYRHVRIDGFDIRAGAAKVGLWVWTAATLFEHRRTRFRSFRRDVRSRFRRLYGSTG